MVKKIIKNAPFVHFWTLGLKKSTVWHYMADVIVLIIGIIVTILTATTIGVIIIIIIWATIGTVGGILFNIYNPISINERI